MFGCCYPGELMNFRWRKQAHQAVTVTLRVPLPSCCCLLLVLTEWYIFISSIKLIHYYNFQALINVIYYESAVLPFSAGSESPSGKTLLILFGISTVIGRLLQKEVTDWLTVCLSVCLSAFGRNSTKGSRERSLKVVTYLLTYLLHGAESFLRS